MKSTRTKLITCILGIASLFSCQYQEEVIEPTTDTNNMTNYYDLLEEGLNTVFNDTYSNVTINTTFGEIANMFEKNSKDFFADKGFIVTDSDIAHTRGVYSSPFDNMNNLNENQKAVVNKVTTILQLPIYNDVRLAISQLYEQTSSLPIQKGKEEILRYIKYIENILCLLEKEKGKIDVLNVLVKSNEFHEIKLNTRSGSVSLPDGMYPHQLDKNKFIMVVQGNVYEFSCEAGLVYCQSAGGCTYPDTCSGDGGPDGWWEKWGKCAAAILGGAGLEGLGGAGIGSVVPGLGTVTGAIIGAISGAFTGAVAGC